MVLRRSLYNYTLYREKGEKPMPALLFLTSHMASKQKSESWWCQKLAYNHVSATKID